MCEDIIHFRNSIKVSYGQWERGQAWWNLFPNLFARRELFRGNGIAIATRIRGQSTDSTQQKGQTVPDAGHVTYRCFVKGPPELL